jgi:hypothetical protein
MAEKYFYAEVLYKSGKRPNVWRFTSKRKRSSALKAFRKDPNVLDIKETEKWEH